MSKKTQTPTTQNLGTGPTNPVGTGPTNVGTMSLAPSHQSRPKRAPKATPPARFIYVVKVDVGIMADSVPPRERMSADEMAGWFESLGPDGRRRLVDYMNEHGMLDVEYGEED